jgi:hypothetical protein
MQFIKKLNIVNTFKYNIPIFSSLILGYYAFKHLKTSLMVNELFSNVEETIISKKITPILKYKLIDKLYSKDSQEHLILSEIYKTLFLLLDMKSKPDVYLFESDVCYLHVLNNGALFISDKIYYNIKSNGDYTLLLYVLLNSVNHVRLKNTSKNLISIFSKVSSLY